MKTTTIILMVIGLVSLSSCEQKTDTNVMLENSETRTELFDAIASNHNYMTEFMGNMQGNDHTMQMMKGNQNIMGNMMKGENLNMILNDSLMSMNMMQIMYKEGKLSEDCMSSSMKMMNDKGMNKGGMHN